MLLNLPILVLQEEKEKIKPLYSWNYENETIVCYGWTQGDAGQENKHELIFRR